MTLHEKIAELTHLGFDVKFDRFSHQSISKTGNIILGLRYHGNGSVKIENTKMITPEQFQAEAFVVSELGRMYQEMKYRLLY